MSEKINEEYDANWAIDLGNVPYEPVTAEFEYVDHGHQIAPMELRCNPAPADITFSNDNEMKVTIHLNDGTYELGEGVELEDASEFFWTFISGDSPQHLRNQLQAAEEEIASLMVWKNLWEQNLEAKRKLATMEDGTDYERAMKVIS